MAAAALFRSRGVAGVRATTGLFFIFTLLFLVCLSSSLVNKDKLKKLKEKIQKAQQKLDMKKAELATSSELMNYYVDLMDPLTGLVKTASEDSPDGFPPLEGVMERLKEYVEKTKTYMDGQYEELIQDIEEGEQKLRAMMKLINSIEEYQDEL